MRLVFPEPVGDRAHVELPGLTLRVFPGEPLDRARARVSGDVEQARTPTGWPVTIVDRDRGLLAVYELFDRGVVVSLTATDDNFDRERARQLLLAADLDRTQRDVVALSQLWDDG